MTKQRRRGLLDHFRGTMQTALDPLASMGLRAEYARQAAEVSHDMRDALRAVVAATSGARVLDLVQAQDPLEAMGRERARREFAAEVRDLGDVPGLLPTNVAPTATGSQPMPLIRTVAGPWSDTLSGRAPLIPGFVTGGAAEVDPVLPAPEGGVMGVLDVAGAAETRHFSILTFSTTRQLSDWLTQDGGRLLDQAVLDSVDLAAEEFVAAALIAGAGGTRVAGVDLGAALDDAESAAGGRGPVEHVVVNAVDLPVVRRVLPATWSDVPSPAVHVSAGQPAGSATYVGRDALLFVASDHQTESAERVGPFETHAAIARPFLFEIRDAALVQTVTGIGA